MDSFDEIKHYDYTLPEQQIAAYPSEVRGTSRLLVYTRDSKTLADTAVPSLVEFLEKDDLLVFNRTKVVDARLLGTKETGGRVELFVLEVIDAEWDEVCAEVTFRCMTRSSKPVRVGTVITLQNDATGKVVCSDRGLVDVIFTANCTPENYLSIHGNTPLPPYIVKRRERTTGRTSWEDDSTRYQTIFASSPGAVAAPTAGLHFTEALLEQMATIGVRTTTVDLRVGAGTFKPVTADRISEHPMHHETYTIDPGLAGILDETKRLGGRVIAVGTTTARTLEAESRLDSPFEPGTRSTNIFLKPGEPWNVCDALFTNFHLPKSTLLALVASFIGVEEMQRLYRHAVDDGYMFYSYGDACLLV